MRKPASAIVAGLLVLAACGDDDSEANEEYAAFCSAELAVEQAIAQQDPEAIQPAFEALSQATPEDAKEVVDKTIAEAQAFLESGEDPTPEFEAAYADLIGVMQDECGFAELDTTGKDYEFEGIDDTVDAGPTIVSMENEGDELHELLFARVNDGVTLTAEELIALPEEEAFQNIQIVGGLFAEPDETGYTVVDLQPGRYLGVCFIPVGLTPEVAESQPDFDGPPHVVEGMYTEFTVE